MLIDQWRNVPVSFFGNSDNVLNSDMLGIKSALYKALDANHRNPFIRYAGEVNSIPLNVFNNLAYKCHYVLREDPLLSVAKLANIITCYPNLNIGVLASMTSDTYYYEKSMNDFSSYHTSINNFNVIEDDFISQWLVQDHSFER